MINSIFIVSTLLGLPTLLASILSQAELWQRKEYRADRLGAALLAPELSHSLLIYALALALAVTGWSALALDGLRQSDIMGLLSLGLLFSHHAWRAKRRGLHRPQLTPKAIFLLLTIILITIVYLWHSAFPLLTPALHWATVILLVPVFTALGVNVVNLAVNWRKHQIINQAARLRQSLPKLEVVGITGSYGKTSTKYFLSQLLPQATVSQEHRNSDFSIAQDMLQQLNDKTQIYIVEMGTYRRGEIKDLAKLTQPRLGLITAIGNQHLATFGSLANIAKAKWELINALPEEGIAVLNADDSILQATGGAAERLPGRGALSAQRDCGRRPGKEPPRQDPSLLRKPIIIWYSTRRPADVYADNITIKPRSLIGRLHIKDSAYDIEIPLAGRAALSNVVAAVAAAHALGADDSQIISRLKQLKPYPRTMEIIMTKKGSTVIDDSYSANEQSVLAAIDHLQRFSQPDKRVILVPLIELGREARAVHQRLGRALAESGATVYIYGHAYQPELTAGAGSHSNVHFIVYPSELIKKATQNLSDNAVILLEGRIPEVVRKSIIA